MSFGPLLRHYPQTVLALNVSQFTLWASSVFAQSCPIMSKVVLFCVCRGLYFALLPHISPYMYLIALCAWCSHWLAHVCLMPGLGCTLQVPLLLTRVSSTGVTPSGSLFMAKSRLYIFVASFHSWPRAGCIYLWQAFRSQYSLKLARLAIYICSDTRIVMWSNASIGAVLCPLPN